MHTPLVQRLREPRVVRRFQGESAPAQRVHSRPRIMGSNVFLAAKSVTFAEPLVDECPPTMRIVPIPSDDADDLERALVEELRARHVASMNTRRELAERVRRRARETPDE